MATVLEEQEEEQGQPTGGGLPQETATGGGAGGAAPGAPPAYQPQQKGSGRFTNIRKYIGANQPAGEQLSSRISREGESAASRVREGIESSRDSFGDQENTLRTGIEQGREAATSAYNAPTDISEEQRGRFDQLYGGGLQQQVGDINTQDYTQQAQSGAQGLQQMADAAGTEKGRFGLLRGTFARPGEKYTTGQQRLDELFLQGTQSAGQLGQRLGGLAKGVGEEVGAFGEDLSGRRTALGEFAGTERDAAENLLLRGEVADSYEGEQYGGGLEDISASLEDRLTNMRTDVLGTEDAPGQYDALRTSLAQNTAPGFEDPIIQQLQDAIGETGNIYNLDLSDFLDKQETVEGRLGTATPEQLATQQEYSRFQNIAGLLGRNGMNIDEGQAGQFNPYELDQERLQTQLTDQRKAAEDAYKADVETYRDQYASNTRTMTPEEAQEWINQDTQLISRDTKYGDPYAQKGHKSYKDYLANYIGADRMGENDPFSPGNYSGSRHGGLDQFFTNAETYGEAMAGISEDQARNFIKSLNLAGKPVPGGIYAEGFSQNLFGQIDRAGLEGLVNKYKSDYGTERQLFGSEKSAFPGEEEEILDPLSGKS